jgi:lipid-binding SYLF domain-containing protein
MKKTILAFLICTLVSGVAEKVSAESAGELQRKSLKSLHHLYDQNPKAQALGEKAVAVLVFPDVVKAGFLVAAQRGDGVLFKNGGVAGYYNITSAGYGLQAGIQKLSYALFFMDEDSLKYLKKSDGFDLAAAPSLVVADQGVGGSMSVASLQHGIAAFIWGQKGLMGGIGLQGTKITKYHPSE